MRRAYYWLAAAAMTGMASASQAADPASTRMGTDPVVAPLPLLAVPDPLLPPAPTPLSSPAPIIVNGYLVYPTNRPTHTLPAYNVLKGPVRTWWDYVRSPQHQAEPDGAMTPIGSGSFWTDWKFAYGSTRQFLGSVDSAPVHRQFFNPELQPGYIIRAWHPKKYGRVQ
jgi:hypothetical protein